MADGSRFQALNRDIRAMVSDAFMSLSARPVRTGAMVAGILLGVASATGALVLADTQQVRIDRQFDAQRSSQVVIEAQSPGPDFVSAAGLAQVLSLEPVDGGGELSIWHSAAPVALNDWSLPVEVPVIGADSGGLAASQTVVTAGAGFDALDSLADEPVVWLGEQLAGQLGVTGRSADAVVISGRKYSVGGVLANGGGFGYLNRAAVVPAPYARSHLGSGETERVVIRVRPGTAGPVGSFALLALDPAQQLGLRDVTPPDGAILRSNVARDLRRVGTAFGVFVGFVGMVAVANTLNMAVHQRRRELGLRSALGWGAGRIATLVLLESAMAGLLASLAGALLGIGGAALWCRLQAWGLIVRPGLAPAVVGVGAVSSVVGGLAPAWRAAAISPLEAMRQ